MKEYLAKKYVFAVIFILFIMFMAVINIKYTYRTLIDDTKNVVKENKIVDVASFADTADTLLQTWDADVNGNVYEKYTYLEMYGFYNRLLGKREYNGFTLVSDKNGYLYNANLWNFTHKDTIPTKSFAERVYNLEQAVKENGTKVYVLCMPIRTMKEYVDFEAGMPYQDFTEVADDYIYYCNTYNLSVIDFRTAMTDSGATREDLYFKTDHHWTPLAAFYAFDYLVEELKQDGHYFDIEDYYTDINNYQLETYEDCWLGTLGIKTGLYYAGDMESFIAINPKYETMFEYTHQSTSTDKISVQNGAFDECLLIRDYIDRQITGNLYESAAYNSYLNGVRKYDSIKNMNNPDGPKVLFIRDSYSSPLGAFFANVCGQVDMIWAKEYDESVEELVENGNYDFIFVATWPENLEEASFNFYKDFDKE